MQEAIVNIFTKVKVFHVIHSVTPDEKGSINSTITFISILCTYMLPSKTSEKKLKPYHLKGYWLHGKRLGIFLGGGLLGQRHTN